MRMLRLLFALLMPLGSALRAEAPVEPGAAGLVQPGVALFLPKGLEPDQLPASLILLQRPRIIAPLPADWKLAPAFSAGPGTTTARFQLDPDVDLYGTGEVTGPLRRNGTQVTLWNTDNFTYERDGGRRLYQSHPWVLGLRRDGSAFGLLFDSTWKAELDCAGGVRFTSQGPAFPVIVIDAADPAAVLARLAELTGRMELPPRWALGYQQCRWSYEPEARVREVAKTFRAKHIPCDVLWLDIDYMEGFRIFSFDKKRFPDPARLNADLHAQGFRTVWMIDPGVKLDPAYDIYQQGTRLSAWVQDSQGAAFKGKVWPGVCVFPDFTRPEVRTWWSGLFEAFLAQGMDGVWNDMNEPSVFGGKDQTMPEDNRHRGGGGLAPGPHLQYHNAYGMLMAQATRDGILAAVPALRPFVLTRANLLGGQRYAATWTGDNESSEAHLRLSVPMSLNLGLSGQPFNGPDLGGFAEDAKADLWARWAAVGAFFPFCRGHASKGTNDKEPWAFGPAVEATARLALQRRYRLLPYLYTCFEEAARTGLPVMRPLWLADPADPALRREERAFLLGPDLMVVPAWAAAAPRPKGDWRPLSLLPGDLEDPLQARLYVRAGAILPLGPVVDSTAAAPEGATELLLCLDAGGRAVGRLYHDAGDGFQYRAGDFGRELFTAQVLDGKATLETAREGSRPLARPMLRLLGAQGRSTEIPY